MFIKIGALKNFANFTQHLCWSLFFSKVAGLLSKLERIDDFRKPLQFTALLYYSIILYKLKYLK